MTKVRLYYPSLCFSERIIVVKGIFLKKNNNKKRKNKPWSFSKPKWKTAKSKHDMNHNLLLPTALEAPHTSLYNRAVDSLQPLLLSSRKLLPKDALCVTTRCREDLTTLDFMRIFCVFRHMVSICMCDLFLNKTSFKNHIYSIFLQAGSSYWTSFKPTKAQLNKPEACS